MTVLILAAEWYGGIDPVTTFDDQYCLDLKHTGSQRRDKLREIGPLSVTDCEFGNEYEMVRCETVP